MRTLAFGDADSQVWGVVWDGVACLGAGDLVQRRDAVPEGEDEWRLLQLTASPVADPVEHSDGFDQLCRVSGEFELDGNTHTVDSLGRRAEHRALEAQHSIREVSAWFEPDGGIALRSLRPRDARGQDVDAVTAAVLDAEAPGPVADPRLSTTYSADGDPLRAGLELWLTDGENEFPLRAAGEALGPSGELSPGVRAQLFRWHSRGREGAGVYVLARGR
jgi:hypothetical protein